MTESNENLDPKVYSLCDEAVKKIDDLEQKGRDDYKNVRLEITKSKKEIVVELAGLLEGIISHTDIISTTILKLLKGRASKSLIHSCLPAKYKQEHRRRNAFKQKKKIRNKINLAPLSALNRQEYSEEKKKEEEEEEKQQKVAVMVGTDGSSHIQSDEDKESIEINDHADSLSKEKTIVQSSSSRQHQQQLEQDNRIEESTDHLDTPTKDTGYMGLANSANKDSEQQPLEEQNQLISPKDKIIQKKDNLSISNISTTDILPFEISWIFRDIRSYLAPLHSKIGDNGKVWFSGLIDKITGQVISHNFGRLNQQHQEGQNYQQNDGECRDSTNRDIVDEF